MYYLADSDSGYVKISNGKKEIKKNLCDRWGVIKGRINASFFKPIKVNSDKKLSVELMDKLPKAGEEVDLSGWETKPIKPPKGWKLKIIGLITA